MNILIIAVAILGALVGFHQGALKQIASMFGIIIGLFAAVLLYNQFGNYLADLTGTDPGISQLIAFVAIVILMPIALGWLASLLTKAFKVVHINFINKFAGAVIGFVSYMLILSVAFNLYDFVVSSGGTNTQKLSERPEMFYKVKQTPQSIMPDFIIVTDSTEEANGAAPRHPINDKLRQIGF